jgi:predicted nucleotidyltransferase
MAENYSLLISTATNNVLSYYRDKTDVSAILLIGSAAQGTFDKYSDIDFLLFFNTKQKLTRKQYIDKSGVIVELLFDDLAEVKNILKKEKYGLQRNTSHMLAHSKVIFSYDGAVEELIKNAQTNMKTKTRYTDKEILMHLYSINDFLSDARRDVDNQDPVAFYLDSNNLIQNMIEQLLKINGQYNVKPNAMKAMLSSLDNEFCSLLIDFDKETDLGKKLHILEAMKAVAIRVAGKNLTDTWEI